jgi:uncharacterized damage-inducible protein DinB
MERTVESTLVHIARVRLITDYPSQINVCLAELDDQQLWWRPDERSNAAGNVVLHLAASNRYYFEHVIGGGEDRRNRDAEFAAHASHSKQRIQETWSDSVAVVDRVLAELDPSRMSERIDRTGRISTFAQILLHVLQHNALHLGQLLYITKMLRPGTINDIWRTKRSE